MQKKMNITNFELGPAEFGKIQQTLASLTATANAKAVFLVNRNGQEIAHSGESEGVDVVALASLAAGSLAATSALARLIGEEEFEQVFLSGQKTSMLITPTGEHSLLVSLVPVELERELDLRKLTQAALVLEDILSKCNRRIAVTEESGS